MQLGNEEAVDEADWRRFKPMAEAIWEKDPNMTIVVGDFAYDRPIRDPYNFRGDPRIRGLATHKKILALAVEHDREIWFDVHVWTGEPRQSDGLGGVPTFIEALGDMNPQARFKVAVFELNANNHALRRALSNAHAINELKRLGPTAVLCHANDVGTLSAFVPGDERRSPDREQLALGQGRRAWRDHLHVRRQLVHSPDVRVAESHHAKTGS
jgi:hypothetical protein